MEIIHGVSRLKRYKNPVVAIGVFDGVHRGHQKLLRKAVSRARRICGTSIVLTLFPHPQKQESLSSLEHRLKLIQALDVDVCIVVNFNSFFASLSPEDFIKKILADKLNARYIYVGKNFRFGKNARGDVAMLSFYSRSLNYKVAIFELVGEKKGVISSSFIRGLICRGKLDKARRLLGRPVSILGTVIRGNSLAATLGFPTANINPHHEIVPPSGVYAAYVFFRKKHMPAMCYIGTRPTIAGIPQKKKNLSRRRIEVHIFDFSGNLYGRDMEIQFVKKVRNEKKFDSLDSLSAQIRKDAGASLKILSQKQSFYPAIHN